MKYYRLSDHLVSAGVDEYDNSVGPARVHVYVTEFEVVGTTPKGVWISNYGQRRFILSAARKQYACPTLEQAKASFVARKKRQIGILNRQIYNAERALEAVDRIMDTYAAGKVSEESQKVTGKISEASWITI